MPRLYLLPAETPNAFATGRNPQHAAVAVTEGILRIMSEEELEGVLAHELSHVLNRDVLTSTIAATLAGAVMMLANMARWGAIFAGSRRDDDNGGGLNPIALLVTALLAPTNAYAGPESIWSLTPGTEVRNPSFDVTPAELITGIVTEEGVVSAPFETGLTDAITAARTRWAPRVIAPTPQPPVARADEPVGAAD